MRYLFKVRGVPGGKKKRDLPPETQSSRRIPSKFHPYVSTPAVGTLACDIIKCQHNLAALSLNLTRTTMSDKFREFIEIPQQFVRDGNQVCFFLSLVYFHCILSVHPIVPHTLHETL